MKDRRGGEEMHTGREEDRKPGGDGGAEEELKSDECGKEVGGDMQQILLSERGLHFILS